MIRIQPKVTNPTIGTIYVIMSAVFFSLGGFMIKLMPWSSMAISSGRCIFALATMGVYLRLIGHKFRFNISIFLGGVCAAIMSLTFVSANKLTSAANTIILQFTHPIFLILLLWFIYKQKPDKKAVITCIIAMTGIIFFFLDQITGDGMIGNILAIISGLAYAIMFLLKKTKNSDFESSMIISYIILVLVGLPDLCTQASYAPHLLVMEVILGVFQTGMAIICLSRGLDAVPPVTASLTSGIEPILNPILTAIICGEVIGTLSLFGGVLVIGSVLTYSLLQVRAAHHTSLHEL